MKRLFILSSVILLVGCTITKRHFGAGYHVEWKKSYSKEKNESEKLNLTEWKDDYSDEPEIQLKSILSSVDSTDLIPQKSEELVTDELALKEIPSGEIEASEQAEVQNPLIQENPLPENQDEAVDEVELKTEPLTWVSLILFFVAGIFIGMIASYGSILFVGAGILMTCLMIAMFVCSLISLIRIHRHPDRYKNKGLTNFVFSFSIICLLTAIAYLLGVAALASMTPMLQGI